MGIFSNETVIVVGVSTQQLVKGKYTELKDTALDSLINDKEFIMNVMETATNGFRSNVLKYHRQASTIVNNQNTLETYWPDVIFKQSLSGDITSFILRQVKSIFIDFGELLKIFHQYVDDTKVFNKVYWTDRYTFLYYLRQHYMPNWLGWNKDTKELTTYPPEINLTGTVSKVKWEGNELSMELFESGCILDLEVQLTDGTVKYFRYTPINIDSWLTQDKNLLVFGYLDGTEKKELFINVSSLDKSIQNQINTNYTIQAQYIPTLSIRKSFVNLIEDQNNPNLIPVKKALDQIGLDLKSLTDSVMSTSNGNNPNIIDDAFTGFGVNIRTNNKLCISYLFDFFSYFITSNKATNTEETWNKFLTDYTNPAKSYFLKDRYNIIQLVGGDNNSYRHQIRYLYSNCNYKNGNIGAINECRKEIIIRPTITVGSYQVDVSSLVLRKQITQTKYVEIEVVGLMYVAETYPSVVAQYYLKDYENDSKNHIFLPIIFGLLDSYGVFEQGELFKESLTITVFAKDTVTIPWYLTADFLKLVQITLIVVSLLSAGTATPATSSFYELVKKFAIEAIKQIIIAKILEIAIKELSDIIGYDATLVLIAIAMLYGGYELTFGDMPWAADLLKVSQLAQNAFNNQIQEDISDLEFKDNQLEEKYKSALNEINKIADTLNQNGSLLAMARRYSFALNPSETPDMFYNRTVHAGNVGVTSLDTISTYVDRSLELPKLKNFGIIKERT